MPNLTLRYDPARTADAALAPLLTQLEADLIDGLNVPTTVPNVMAIEMQTGPNTTPVYIDLIYRATQNRPEDAVAALGKLLAQHARDVLDTDVAFRGFPMQGVDIIACDVRRELPERPPRLS